MKRDNDIKESIKKPDSFIAPYSDREVSEAELERRKRKNNRLRSIGVNPKKIVDEESETENPYRVKAMVYITRDEEVPKKLLEKMNKYDTEIKKHMKNNND